MSCQICCEPFTSSLRKEIICNHSSCDFSACKPCIKRYMLGSHQDPHCMNCKNPYDFDFIKNNLNKTFFAKEYAAHRKEILFQREKSRFPETMQLAENEKAARDLCVKVNSILSEIQTLKNQLTLKVNETRKVRRRINALRNKPLEAHQKFVLPCSREDCNGFLSTSYKCGICHTYTCKDCLVTIESDDHVCNEDDVKTAQLIRESTKPCPSCGERIQKIDGCDQMWCPSCNSAFSWSTGKLDTGPIHNPHYYEYLRNNNNNVPQPRNIGDVVCGGIPHGLLNHLNRMKPFLNETNIMYECKNTEIHKFVIDLHRVITHATHVTLLRYQNEHVQLQDTSGLRVKYMLNDFKTIDDFKTVLLKKDKQRFLTVDMVSIWETFSHVGIDFLKYVDDVLSKPEIIYSGAPRNIANINHAWNAIIQKMEGFEQFICYFNNVMAGLSEKHQIATLRFDVSKKTKGVIQAFYVTTKNGVDGKSSARVTNY